MSVILCKVTDFKLGLKIKLRPAISLDRLGQVNHKKSNAEIAYINRKHKYFTADFKFDTGGSFRESFKFFEADGFICINQIGVDE